MLSITPGTWRPQPTQEVLPVMRECDPFGGGDEGNRWETISRGKKRTYRMLSRWLSCTSCLDLDLLLIVMREIGALEIVYRADMRVFWYPVIECDL